MSRDLARVRYFDRQYLRLEDFVDEQAYHLAAHRRHQLGLHRWGIVGGLRLLLDDETREPYVEAGFAIDGYGRDLVLDVASPAPLTAFEELQSETIDVWLVYHRAGGEPAAPGWVSCAAGVVPDTREIERPRLVADVRDPDLFDPRAPATVPEGDVPFAPHRPAPDEVTDDWPVFLGRIAREGTAAERTYVVDLAGRPYAGAVAAGVATPFDRDRPRVVLGGDHGDGPAFAVRVPAAATPPGAPAAGALVEALAIDPAGDLTAHRHLAVRGELSIEGGALALSRAAPEGQPPLADEARPWRLYRHLQSDDEGGAVVGEQLRVELDGGGELAIGFFSAEEERFVPCLTVDAQGTVTVHGDLVVEGGIEGQVESVLPRIVPGLSEEAARLVLASFQSGLAGTADFLASPVLASRPVAATAASPAAAIAGALAADPGLRAGVAAAMRERDPAGAAALADLLADRREEE